MIRGSIARAAAAVCGHDMYFDIAICWYTNRIETLPLRLVDERHIQEGESGYDFRKLLSHARRLLVSSQTRMLRMGAFVGVAALGVSICYGMFVFIRQLLFPDMNETPGWASLMIIVLFFGGLIALMLGILLEYAGVVLLQIQGKPTFFPVDRSQDQIIRDALLKDSA